MELITSRENQSVKELTGLLTQKKKRDSRRLFVLEGARLCLDALESGVTIRAVYITPQSLELYRDLGDLVDGRCKVVWLHEDLARKISDTKSPQGVFCICERLDNPGFADKIKGNGKYLILDGLQDPGNLGTILRTAQALGVDGAFLCGCPDVYSPKVLRSAMGGLFRLPFAVEDAAAAVVARLQKQGVPVYAAALTPHAASPGQLDLSGGCCVLIGNEGAGLSPEVIRACTGSVMIPMADDANSLNAAAAAAILLWEMTKNRG